MRRFPALVSLFGHRHPFSRVRLLQTDCFSSGLILELFTGASKAHLFHICSFYSRGSCIPESSIIWPAFKETLLIGKNVGASLADALFPFRSTFSYCLTFTLPWTKANVHRDHIIIEISPHNFICHIASIPIRPQSSSGK
jgi:hypothetical protein